MLHWYEWHCDYCADRGKQEAVDDEPTNPGFSVVRMSAGDESVTLVLPEGVYTWGEANEIWCEDGDDGWLWFTRKRG